jgi:predicted DNA-binding protein YlxM (UPF0122 family)
MGMGDEWKTILKQTTSQRILLPPGMDAINSGDTDKNTDSLTPSAYATTANDIINQRHQLTNRGDSSVKSFGDKVYDREHDGNTVQTAIPDLPPDGDTTAPMLDLTGMEFHARLNTLIDEDLSMSTGANTNEGTRQRLRDSVAHTKRLESETRQQHKDLIEVGRENQELMAQMQLLIQRMEQYERDSIASVPSPAVAPQPPTTTPARRDKHVRIVADIRPDTTDTRRRRRVPKRSDIIDHHEQDSDNDDDGNGSDHPMHDASPSRDSADTGYAGIGRHH